MHREDREEAEARPFIRLTPETTPHHQRNPKTHDASVQRFLDWGNDHMRRAGQREGERQSICIECATQSFATAAEHAERAAELRGLRFTRLASPTLNDVTEIVCAAVLGTVGRAA